MSSTSKVLLRSQLNHLIRKIPTDTNIRRTAFRFDRNLETTDFDIKLPIKLVYDESPFFFMIGSNSDYFTYSYFPDDSGKTVTYLYASWTSIVTHFEYWLHKINSELGEPDPWTLLSEAKVLGQDVLSADTNETFDAEDLLTIKRELNSIKEFLLNEVKPTEQQLALIDDKLSYLQVAATRQSKMDWANTAVGVMFTIATGLALAPDQANRLFHLTSELVRSLFVRLLT